MPDITMPDIITMPDKSDSSSDPRSVTPPQHKLVIESTPYRKDGISTSSGSQEGPFRKDLAPSLFEDMQQYQKASIDGFLCGMLELVRERPPPENAGSLQPTTSHFSSPRSSLVDLYSLIQSVGVPIANEFCDMVGRELLETFCKESVGTKGYLTFCKIVNSILAKTKTQEVGGFLKRNKLDILLHNTSECHVPAHHAGQYSIRIPDCTFLPCAIAMLYYDEDTLQGKSTRNNHPSDFEDPDKLWNAIVTRFADKTLSTKAPSNTHKYMGWDTPLGVVGVKSGRSHKPKIPALYVGTKLADDTREDYVNRTDSRNTKEGSPISQSPHEASIGGSHSASKRKAIDEAGPHPEKMIKTDSGRGVSSPYPGSESGIRSIESELISEIQFGGYNAEMLSAATVIRKHTIGMMYKGWYNPLCAVPSN
ncbi:hypothetical protein M408DRAFT_116400 [Serendipita vermifera MAFF 305830]|uniref:Uncharacterized protein n=1 Tax=Serendipita vermifera MAFF 305830 TaxID=933852 RepID=A0A0C3BDX6_SERVB|nr:hypothetical protein M408DRAFT_116400 [Serendipita vermifera MAFF 305830]